MADRAHPSNRGGRRKKRRSTAFAKGDQHDQRIVRYDIRRLARMGDSGDLDIDICSHGGSYDLGRTLWREYF